MEKQIEEMYKDIYEAINHNAVIDIPYIMGEYIHSGYIGVNTDGLTRELYDTGYRKASDVAREIFEEIEEKGKVDEPIVEYYILSYSELAELKKKYTESEKEITEEEK